MNARQQSPRLRLLRKLSTVPHRYSTYRKLTQGLTLVILVLVPLSGLARFDLWGGEHYALMRPTDAVAGLIAVIVAIAALYLVTFSANVVCGRLFCGWGCPVAEVARLGESLQCARTERRGRRAAYGRGALFGAALSGSVMLWWVSPKVLLHGSVTARAVTLGVFVLLVALTFLHGRYLRWTFCRAACPIGLYYSVVAMDVSHGVTFHRDLETCKDCRLCDTICPVGLAPRDLTRLQDEVAGLGVTGLPGDNHCLRCGDCVTACEFVFRKEGDVHVPLEFGLGRKGVPLHPHRTPLQQEQTTSLTQGAAAEGVD